MYKFFLFFFALSMVTMAQVSPDSTTTTGRIITYEEFKKNQEKEQQITTVTDSIKPTIEVVTDTTSMVNIPVITIATATINEYPEVDKFDENLLKELYNNDMYDYMYDEVIQMDYSEAVMKTLPTDTLKARLKRINETTPFQIDYNPVLEQLINKKLSHQRIYMERLMTLSDYYFPLFEEMLDKYDIPLEMKYLAVVESALDPRAKSRVGATGLWQFMFATGRDFDLEVNSYVDERMDPIKSTEAACKFLKSLYNIYGDWDLALAAYNSGPGNVNKAIRRSGGYKNYWNLRPYLPRETAGYVPAFQAMVYLYTYASEHGFQPAQTAYKTIATDTIRVKKMISLEHVAQFTDEDIETIQFHNPSYKLDIIPAVSGRNYYLRLPVRAAGKFVSSEDAVYAFAKAELDKKEKPLPELVKAESRVVYRVKNGDYLGKIANKYGVKVSQLKRWNSLRSNNLKIGQRLYIHPRKPITSGSTSSKKAPGSYKVKSGDSLWKIANTYGITIAQIRKLNPGKTEDLQPGTTLKLK
ncbi:LysM peptidoglycan-binding domain-containing protein [Nonlabens ulvanivorans]|uniref:lytic transglycosylase domain-containing protein n=1 Tax=Nonlabens ulvanivorans TaxID=906888 RepID=UPI0037C9FCA6